MSKPCDTDDWRKRFQALAAEGEYIAAVRSGKVVPIGDAAFRRELRALRRRLTPSEWEDLKRQVIDAWLGSIRLGGVPRKAPGDEDAG